MPVFEDTPKRHSRNREKKGEVSEEEEEIESVERGRKGDLRVRERNYLREREKRERKASSM